MYHCKLGGVTAIFLFEGAAGGEGQDSVGEPAQRPQVHHQKPQLGRHAQEHTEPTGDAPLEVVGPQAL